jgi:anthranilate synthase component 1
VTTGEIRPSREQFRVLAAAHPVVPVTRRLLADGETPVGVYRKLAGGPDTFLLESAEHGRSWSRYSFVGVRCPARLVERDGVAVWDGAPPPGLPASGEPFAMLKASVAALRAPRVEGLPPLLGGLVGFVSYDAVRRLERLPEHTVDDLGVPELELLLATDLAVLDHSDGSVLLVADAFTTGGDLGTAHHSACDSAYDDAVARLESMTADLSRAAEPTVATLGDVPDADLPSGFAGFRDAVTRATEEIRAGECFQVVVSQRFDRPTTASALDIYRVLRTLNPSPYMYLLRFDGHDVVGSSPEALVTVSGGRARIHPIAGTRWRGATPEEDAALAAELLADPKERSEHVMLVDLGRNDLGRVCRPGTVRVVEFGTVERYSHVMHIVSTVVGEVAEDRDAVDVLAATFPAGTLSGAPKPRAMEIIDELEPTRRGLYGGAIVYLDLAGDLDSAIAIRTAYLAGGVAHVQAGGGIVADSDPAAEDRESRNKAAAVLRAIALAETLGPPA